MTVGLVAALGAALCYGVGTVLQAVAAKRTDPGALDPRLLIRLAGQLPYLAGLGLDVGGFALNVVALRSLPLFLVQSTTAASVGVTALVAVAVLRHGIRRGEAVALVAMMLGLVLLALGAKPGPARALSHLGQWALLASVAALALVASASARRESRATPALLAGCAGAAFGGVGVAARGLDLPHPLWRVVTLPAAWSLAAFGLLAVLLFATALQRGSVTVVAAVMSAVETVLPSIVGLTVLGDSTRGGLGYVAAAAGFAFTLAGAVALAPYAEPVPS